MIQFEGPRLDWWVYSVCISPHNRMFVVDIMFDGLIAVIAVVVGVILVTDKTLR